MSQGPLCPNLTQKVQKEVSQMANHNFSLVILLGGLSVNLNHLKISRTGCRARQIKEHTLLQKQKNPEKSVVQIAELTRKTTKMHMKTGKTSRTDRKTRQNISKFTAFKGL